MAWVVVPIRGTGSRGWRSDFALATLPYGIPAILCWFARASCYRGKYVGERIEANQEHCEPVDFDDYDSHYVHYTRFGRGEKQLASQQEFPTHPRSEPGGGFFRFTPSRVTPAEYR